MAACRLREVEQREQGVSRGGGVGVTGAKRTVSDSTRHMKQLPDSHALDARPEVVREPRAVGCQQELINVLRDRVGELKVAVVEELEDRRAREQLRR
jgi:hypothetical protein